MTTRLWKLFTSLKLTVVLLGLCTLLVFLGTIAQVHEGLWQAQERWFKSFFVIRNEGDVWWVPPIFPGGYTLGFGLLFNLLAAHIKRFQFTWKKAGIQLTHFGIILLLGGQLLTDLLARESFMSFAEGETRSFSEAHRAVEFVVNMSQPDQPGMERVISFAQNSLASGRSLSHKEMPFTVKISEYGENADVLPHASVLEAGKRLTTALATLEANYSTPEGIKAQWLKADQSQGRIKVWREAVAHAGEQERDLAKAVSRLADDPNRFSKFSEDLKSRFRKQMLAAFQAAPRMQAQGQDGRAMSYVAKEASAGRPVPVDNLPAAAVNGAGPRMVLVPLPPVRAMDAENSPYAKVELFEGEKSLGTWLVSTWLSPQEVSAGGKTFRFALRNERYFQPFSLTLLKTTHEVYQGTQIPKNFQSRVRIENGATGERREVDISMNNPLRYGGLTYYQSQMGRTAEVGGKGTSVLQVVRNPGWLTPYLGCIVVALGMLWQFFYHLVGFLTKPRAASKPQAA